MVHIRVNDTSVSIILIFLWHFASHCKSSLEAHLFAQDGMAL